MSIESTPAGFSSRAPRLKAPASRRFERFASFVLGYLLLVIVFGAWVRVTGSGAGCGEHWPTCHGVLVPRAPSAATLIEYSHRFSSGLLGFACLALPIWAFLRFPAKHPARRFSLLTFILVMVEAAIGARLVLQGLVADDASLSRAVAVALHLVNTLLLTASAALTIASARDEPEGPALGAGRVAASTGAAATASRADLGAARRSLTGLLIGLVVVAATGAVTALGDTLFPVPEGEGASLPEHFLVQLRVVHPVLACGAVLLGLHVAQRFAEFPKMRGLAKTLGAMVIMQLALGATNIVLRAPAWLQLAHLLLAQLLWISAVLLAWRSRARGEAALRGAPAQPASPSLGPSALP